MKALFLRKAVPDPGRCGWRVRSARVQWLRKAGSPTSTYVDSDVRLALSNNAFQFKNIGDVLSHANSSVWGYGDELFPVGAFRSDDICYIYYIAKGTLDWLGDQININLLTPKL